VSTDHEETGEAAVAFAAGVLVGLAATLLVVRIRCRRRTGSTTTDDDYHYDGGELFI
jgi:hypothetical protein